VTDAADASASDRPWLVFVRGQRLFAVPAIDVRLVLPTPRLSVFPTGFERMLGLFAHRGKIYPLVDPNDGHTTTGISAPIAIVTTTESGEVAWVADQIRAIERGIDSAVVEINPSELAQRAREAMRRSTRLG
jgi:chemotaxis signal transduction protein